MLQLAEQQVAGLELLLLILLLLLMLLLELVVLFFLYLLWSWVSVVLDPDGILMLFS